MKRIFASISHRWKRLAVGQRVILVLLGLLVVAFAVYLNEGPKPWREGIEPREEAGKRVRIDNYAVDGIYQGVIICLVITVLMIPFAGFFGRKLTSDFEPAKRRKVGKLEGLLLLAVVVGSALLTCRYALPRFDHSLWHDEELSMRRVIVKDHLRVGEDGLADRFGVVAERPVRWEETLWFYEAPNNHMLFSVWARVMHAMWPPENSPGKPYFNTVALRTAALIPALLTLAVLAGFLSLIGMRVAAFALPPLLALHPWFIRYASEVRGYSLAFLLISLCLLFFWKAVQTGKWRWFSAYGLVQFFLLFTNPASVWFLVALNGAGFVGFLMRKGEKADRVTLIGRFVFTNLLAGMVTLVMMMPIYLQLKLWDGDIGYGSEVFKNMAGSFLAGMRWVTWSDTLDYVVSVEKQLAEHPIAVGAVLSGYVVLALLGIFALWRRGGWHLILIPVLILPLPLFLAFALYTRAILYHWYVVNLLPIFWIAVAIGIGYLVRLIAGKSERREMVAGGILIVLAVGSMWWVGMDQRRLQINVPLERTLESVLATRDVLDPFDPKHDEVLTVGFFKYTRAYDPGHYRVRTAEEMRRMMAKADAENKPLYVNFAMPDFARDHQPEIMEILDDPELFEVVDVFTAMEDTATRWVIQYKPGSLEKKSGG